MRRDCGVQRVRAGRVFWLTVDRCVARRQEIAHEGFELFGDECVRTRIRVLIQRGDPEIRREPAHEVRQQVVDREVVIDREARNQVDDLLKGVGLVQFDENRKDYENFMF